MKRQINDFIRDVMNVDTFIRRVAMVMSWPKVNFHSVCLLVFTGLYGIDYKRSES